MLWDALGCSVYLRCFGSRRPPQHSCLLLTELILTGSDMQDSQGHLKKIEKDRVTHALRKAAVVHFGIFSVKAYTIIRNIFTTLTNLTNVFSLLCGTVWCWASLVSMFLW